MKRWIATGLLAAVLGTMMPAMASASVAGRRNTALGLAGAAVYTWLNGGTRHAGRRNTAIALTAGTLYAWNRYNQARRAERRRSREVEYYRSRYYSSDRPVYYSSYRPYSRVSGYRSHYGRRRYSGRRRHGSTYLAGYRAGYRRGVRACQIRHGHV